MAFLREGFTLPLHSRIGVIAYALVDHEDHARLSEYRWYRNARGYASRSIYRADIYAHRGELEHGDRTWTKTSLLHREVLNLPARRPFVVHIKQDKLDSRKMNLRTVTNAQNCQNRTSSGKSSRFRGVHWDSSKGKWRAVGKKGYQFFHIGRFNSELDAALAAYNWRQENLPFSE